MIVTERRRVLLIIEFITDRLCVSQIVETPVQPQAPKKLVLTIVAIFGLTINNNINQDTKHLIDTLKET